MKLQKWKRKILAVILAVGIFAGSVAANGTQAAAAEQRAAGLAELAQVIRDNGMQRKSRFSVDFSGSDEEWSRLFNGMSFFYYDMIVLDDASTSDDSDYLIGNINFSKEFMSASVEEESGNGEIIFTPTYFETADETEYVNTHTKEILAELGTSQMSDYSKVKAVHDYVCALITYTNDVDNASSVYGAYVRGKGLCNSYALCMYKLLVEAGVPCHWIGGSAGTGRDSAGHAWNIVKLGDQWYNLDATWDDADNDKISYDYFLKGTADFDEADTSQVHTMDNEYYESSYLTDFPIAETSYVVSDEDLKPVTPTPTQTPSASPSAAPTEAPAQTPSASPSAAPTEAPTQTPSASPSAAPTEVPTQTPSASPSAAPTEAPTQTPSVSPSTTPESPVSPVMPPTTTPGETKGITVPGVPTDTTEDSLSEITKYSFSDIIVGKYPAKGKFTISRKKADDIQLLIDNKAARKKIAKISYKITSGKKIIKTKNYGIRKDGKQYFSNLRVFGKKKGKAKIAVTVKLINGQKKKYNFTVRVR
jgi:predicted transglutaminase-like cysteine proteinase